MTTLAPSNNAPPTPDQNTPDPPTNDLLEQLSAGLPGLSERWLPRAGELSDFLERWETAWNTHDLDLLEALVTEDIVCEDPAMFGETAHGRHEFRAFTELFFRAFPDVHLEGHRRALPCSGGQRARAAMANDRDVYGRACVLGQALRLKAADMGAHRTGDRHRGHRPVRVPRRSHLSPYALYDLYDFSQQIGLLPPRDSQGARGHAARPATHRLALEAAARTRVELGPPGTCAGGRPVHVRVGTQGRMRPCAGRTCAPRSTARMRAVAGRRMRRPEHHPSSPAK